MFYSMFPSDRFLAVLPSHFLPLCITPQLHGHRDIQTGVPTQDPILTHPGRHRSETCRPLPPAGHQHPADHPAQAQICSYIQSYTWILTCTPTHMSAYTQSCTCNNMATYNPTHGCLHAVLHMSAYTKSCICNNMAT